VHFVDEIYDHGEIIAQWPVPVLEDDDAERLAGRVLDVEHRLLPAVVGAFAEGAFRLDAGHVRWTRPWFPGEAFEMNGTYFTQ
jgi:phosphoribosylglycinamide formyltransferase-1